jgi:IS5 family transposase
VLRKARKALRLHFIKNSIQIIDWVELANLLPWDEICNLYLTFVPIAKTGRPPLNPRVVLEAIIIKHLCNLDDREIVV